MKLKNDTHSHNKVFWVNFPKGGILVISWGALPPLGALDGGIALLPSPLATPLPGPIYYNYIKRKQN